MTKIYKEKIFLLCEKHIQEIGKLRFYIAFNSMKRQCYPILENSEYTHFGIFIAKHSISVFQEVIM